MSIRHLIITSILMFCFSYSPAQKSTELYIPIGKSPGLSGKYTTLGKVESINLQDSTITIAIEAASKTIKIKGHPEVMLDNSDLKVPNKMGSLTDIKEGVLIEVKYRYNKPDDSIEWIKCKINN